MTLGEKLRSLRAVSGWTQPECATKIEIEQSYLSKLENDKSIPSAEVFDALCATYNVSSDEIIRDLDKAYTRKNLMHIPIVSASTNGQSEHIKKKRKKNIILCCFSILAAVLLFSLSYFKIIPNDNVYNYYSKSIDYRIEINECLKSSDEEVCYMKFTQAFNARRFPHSTVKQLPEALTLREYKGPKFHLQLDKGFRVFELETSYEEKSLHNKTFLLLSVLIFTLGLLGLFVEARFYRIDKQ